MAFVRPWQDSFNGGELSPLMRGRIRQDVWGISMDTMAGFIPLLQGPAEAAPGTIHVQAAAGNGRLLPFEFNVTQGYVIEACVGAFRFYTNDVRIETSPGVPLEVAHSYTLEQLQTLQYCQSGDVLYLFHEAIVPRKLVRTGAISFALQDLALKNGPWESRNSDESLTLSASAVSGTGVTMTASAALFAATDVGSLIEIEFGDLSAITSWEPGITISAGERRQWDGRVYEVESGSKTGTVAPVHVSGSEWDGMASGTDINDKPAGGVKWAYLFDRFGQVKITGFTSATQVTVTVERRLAAAASAQYRWRFGAFSATRGWPQCGIVWKNRLVLARDWHVFGSVIGDFENFNPRNELGEVSRDMAFAEPLPDPNRVCWMAGADDLQLGTAKREYVLRPASAAAGFGPGNVEPLTDTEEGAAFAMPVRAAGQTIYIQAERNTIVQFGKATVREGYDTEDLTRYADHMGNEGFAEIAWLGQARRLLAARTDTGELRFALYLPAERALGWCKRPMAEGLTVRSMAVITGPDGRAKQLWLLVQDGAAFRVMRMAPIRRTGDVSLNQVMSDAAWIFEGTATTAINVPHLAGRTVEIVADGRLHRGVTLDGSGAGTLDFAAATIIVGLPYPAYMISLPLEAGGDNGAAQMRRKRISHVGVRLLASDGLSIKVGDQKARPIELQRGNSVLDAPFALFTGDHQDECMGDFDAHGQVRIDRIAPKPSTVLALLMDAESGTR